MNQAERPKPQVLAVEDNANLAILMQRALHREDVELTIADSGERAMELVRQLWFDLIVLNINLPGISGLEVCRRLKSDPALHSIPVIFASGETSRPFMEEAFRLGATDYLHKPFGLPEFTARVLTHLGPPAGNDADAVPRRRSGQGGLNAPAHARPTATQFSHARILYVEDQPAVAALVQLELEQARLSVTTVPNGEQGLAMAREQKFDLILLDHWLPGINGAEVCRRLKCDPALHDIPVIFFTAYPSLAHEHEASRLGAVDYLQKGVLAPRLAARILAEVELARDRTSRQSKKGSSDTDGTPPSPQSAP